MKCPLKGAGVNTLPVMLDPLDRSLLDFERDSMNMPGPKDWNIESKLGLTSAVYYTRIRQLIFEKGAWQYDALTVARLRSMIEHDNPVEAVG